MVFPGNRPDWSGYTDKNDGATKFKGRLTLNSDITIDYNYMFKLLYAIILDFNSITRHWEGYFVVMIMIIMIGYSYNTRLIITESPPMGLTFEACCTNDNSPASDVTNPRFVPVSWGVIITDRVTGTPPQVKINPYLGEPKDMQFVTRYWPLLIHWTIKQMTSYSSSLRQPGLDSILDSWPILTTSIDQSQPLSILSAPLVSEQMPRL